jgi:hypothetical protein
LGGQSFDADRLGVVNVKTHVKSNMFFKFLSTVTGKRAGGFGHHQALVCEILIVPVQY